MENNPIDIGNLSYFFKNGRNRKVWHHYCSNNIPKYKKGGEKKN